MAALAPMVSGGEAPGVVVRVLGGAGGVGHADAVSRVVVAVGDVGDAAAAVVDAGHHLCGWLPSLRLPQAGPEPSMKWMTRSTLTGEGHNHGTTNAHKPGNPMPASPPRRTSPSYRG